MVTFNVYVLEYWNKNKQTNKTNKKTDQEHFTELRLDKTPTVTWLKLAKSLWIPVDRFIHPVCNLHSRCLQTLGTQTFHASINRQAFTRDRFGKCKRIEGKKHNFCTLNACEILIHLVVIFLSQVIFVFLLFLDMVMYAIWSWNKRKTKITWDKKLTTTYVFYEFLNGFLYGFYMTTRCREDKLQIFLLPQHPILNRSNFL